MPEYTLREIFGISTDVPKYTYIDRQKLDKKFEYYLGSQKHIVVHGASKQGKSCLRKKNVAEDKCLIIQCLPAMENVEDVWRSALQKAGVSNLISSSLTKIDKTNLESSIEGGAKLPFLANINGKVGTELATENSETKENMLVQSDSFLPKLATLLREKDQRLILEDFHYLPDNVRQDIAFGLKAFYEEKAYVVIIGIWSEQNLLTYYNGDLTGRIEEINLTWDNEELSQVLTKGEDALNIEFSNRLREKIIDSVFNNIGLLQRLAEKICMESEVFKSQEFQKVIKDENLLEQARIQLVDDIRQRYTKIAEVFKGSMRADSVLLMYARIYNELLDASDNELIQGIPFNVLFKRIQDNAGDKTIRQGDLTSALDKIERLQSKRGVTPLLVSYSKGLGKLFLNDREFMFYRKYSGDNILRIDIDNPEVD